MQYCPCEKTNSDCQDCEGTGILCLCEESECGICNDCGNEVNWVDKN